MLNHETIAVKPLFDRESCTYTYLVWDKVSKDAILIDGVKENSDRDLRLIQEHSLNLKWTLETHVHADHITSCGPVAKKLDAKIGVSIHADIHSGECVKLEDESVTKVSPNMSFKVLFTPGHTSCSVCFVIDGHVFTGDTLFIRGCGRTDFQAGSSVDLYNSVRNKLFTLPDETIVFPGHDYKGEIFSTIGEEKEFNPRLKMSNSLEDFVTIMDNLNLALPAKIRESIPANQQLGF